MIEFPLNNLNAKHFNNHINFVLQWLKLSGQEINLVHHTEKVWTNGQTYLSITIDGKQVVFDPGDHHVLMPNFPEISAPYFKFHYSEKEHGKHSNIIPLGPMLGLRSSESEYQYLNELIQGKSLYHPQRTNIIQSKQRIFGDAVERRRMVQDMLKYQSSFLFDNSQTNISNFWKGLENVFISVCVPGARENMLDRGQWEQMGLGICTISPELDAHLAYDKKLIPGEHYIACKLDYSDLTKQIEWCSINRDKCKEIGDNAKELFAEIYTPERYFNWIETKTKEYYEI